MPTKTKSPKHAKRYASRSPEARRARHAVRRYLRLSIVFNALAADDDARDAIAAQLARAEHAMQRDAHVAVEEHAA